MGWTRGKRIGKGSYGEVFIAIPSNPDSPIMAVKSAPEEKADSLMKEQRILEQFRGVPGVVQCFGGEITQSHHPGGGRTYNLLMEFAPRGSLVNLIVDYSVTRLSAGIPESHVRGYTRMILQALSSIHSQGYIHGDIKPDNILVFPPAGKNRGGKGKGKEKGKGKGLCELKIADFGLATKTLNLSPGRKRLKGTIPYMAPEAVVKGNVSPAIDIWAVGCTVIEMLTGKLPWNEYKEDGEVERKIGEWRKPQIPEWVSEQGKDFLRKCFARYLKRPQHVDMFLEHPFVADCDVIHGDRRMKTAVMRANDGGGLMLEEKQRRPVAPPHVDMFLKHPLVADYGAIEGGDGRTETAAMVVVKANDGGGMLEDKQGRPAVLCVNKIRKCRFCLLSIFGWGSTLKGWREVAERGFWQVLGEQI